MTVAGEKKMGKRKLQSLDELQNCRDNIFDQLHGESDRGCILVAASILDDALGALLQALVQKRPAFTTKRRKELLGFFGPLGSFSSRIAVAYAFGLIPDWMYKNLELIRNIRNDFAHGYESTDFSNEKLISKVDALKAPDDNIDSLVSKYTDGKRTVGRDKRVHPLSRTKFVCHALTIYGILLTARIEEKKDCQQSA